jgi:hypothetical protein
LDNKYCCQHLWVSGHKNIREINSSGMWNCVTGRVVPNDTVTSQQTCFRSNTNARTSRLSGKIPVVIFLELVKSDFN